MEINLKDYIRTKSGYIGKVHNINEFREPNMKYAIEIPKADDFVFMGEEHITKHSKDIIDLIEVGDYVNGWLVYEVQIIDNDEERTFVSVDECYDNYCGFIYNKDIKEILTRELYEENCYKVVE